MHSDDFPRGAAWLRADFHLHTRADKEFRYTGPENSFVRDYVLALKKAGIAIGVVTNHNKFDWDEFRALSKATRAERILLLPGVELSVGDGANGVHVLVVFSDEWLAGGDYINGFLRTAFDGKLPEAYENENGRSSLNLLDTIAKLEFHQRDFFLVFAHVEQSSGLLKELGGGRIQELGRNDRFRTRALGCQKVRTRDLRKKVRGWLGDAYPAEVEGCDCKSLEELANSSEAEQLTFLKVGALTFQAVKYALQDGEHRLRGEVPRIGHSHIEGVAFEGGVLAGKSVGFSPELNTLIGIRGSGKSSILEAVRYALGIPFGDRATDRSYKEELVAHTLGSGGKVTVTALDRHGQRYEVRRILKEQPEVYVEGRLQPGVSIRETVLHKPIYFGQKDLSSSGEGFERELIEKLVGPRLADIRRQIDDRRNRVRDAIMVVQKLATTDDRISEYTAKRQDAKHQLQLYEKHGVAEKMQKQVAFDTDTRHIELTLEAVRDYLSATENVINDHEDGLKKQPTYKSQYNADFFADFFRRYEQALASLADQQAGLAKAKAILAELTSKKEDFSARRGSLKEEFAQLERKLTEELKAEGAAIRLEEFKQVQANLNQAERMLETLSKLNAQRLDAQEQLMRQLSQLNRLWQEEFRLLQNELQSINDDGSALKIVAEFKGDKAAAVSYMKDLFRGSRLREAAISDLLKQYSDFGAIYNDLRQAKELVGASAAPLEERFLQNLSELLTWQVPNRFTIEFHGKELKQHSLGQRASALILFILSQRDNDAILIDQPEDDLDNQTIYEDVIKLVCRLKPSTQFIFATHNPNFPVLGDAEQIVACRYEEERIETDSGGIDDPNQQQRIVSIMEGGSEAFRRRKERYEAWTHQNS